MPGIPASKDERAAIITIATLFGTAQQMGENYDAARCFDDAEAHVAEMRKRGLSPSDLSNGKNEK